MNIEKIKEALRSLLVECNNTMSDKGNLFYNGDEIIVGATLYSDEDMATIVEDGDYEVEGKVITVVDGKVSEINEKKEDVVEEETTVEAEEETIVEETVVEEEPETVEEDNTIDELKGEIEALKGEIEALKGTIESILEKVNAPMAEPITEEFSKVTSHSNKWDRYAEIINSIKK